jgi:hypothetical protein
MALLLAAHFRLPYGFYTLTRLVVSVEAAVVAWYLWEAGGTLRGVAVLFGLLVLAFNPIVPVRLSRDQWALIDPLVAAIFLGCAILVRRPWNKHVAVAEVRRQP